jgi:hypothetical protein
MSYYEHAASTTTLPSSFTLDWNCEHNNALRDDVPQNRALDGTSALFLSEFDETWHADRVSHPEQKLQLKFFDCPTASPGAKFRRMPQSFIVKLFCFLRYMRVVYLAACGHSRPTKWYMFRGYFGSRNENFLVKTFKTTEKYPVSCITSFIFSTTVMTKLTYVIEGVKIHMCAKFHFLKPVPTRAMSAQSRLFTLISYCITHHLLRVPRNPTVFSYNFW